MPVMPEDISITARGTNTLTFRWTLPKGGFERYVVNISNRDLNFVNSSTTTNNTTNFAGLLPGRLFFVTVTAVAGNFRNTSAQFPAATGKFVTLYRRCCHDFVLRSRAAQHKVKPTESTLLTKMLFRSYGCVSLISHDLCLKMS